MAIPALTNVVMLLILLSLARHAVPGMRQWIQGSVLFLVALLGYALWRTLPAFASVVLANAVFFLGLAYYYAGCRRFFGLAVPWRGLYAATLACGAAMAALFYGHDDVVARIIVTSAAHGILFLMLADTLWRHRPRGRPVYIYALALGVALANAAGHVVRIAVYAGGMLAPERVQESTGFATVFVQLGALGISALTMCMIIMAQDRLLASTERLANLDHLTAVGSRKAFMERLDFELARASRGGAGFALLLVDLDHFKQINDSLGHAAGDAALVHFARLAGAAVRNTDFVGRLGGEEFGLLLAPADEASAAQADGRLRSLLQRTPCWFQGSVLPYRYSAGLAIWQPGDTATRITARADALLYEAKRQGRNRTVSALPSVGAQALEETELTSEA